MRHLARPRRLAALALPVALAGCITINTKGYPTVARTDITRLSAADADTTWALARPPFTVVGRYSETLDVPGGLTGVARTWERMFGEAPTPVTIVLVEVPARGLRRGERPVPPTLPDSLARRTVVYVPTARFDDGERERRTQGPPIAGTPVMMGGPGGTAAMQVAQAWLEQRLGGPTSAEKLPPWLRASLVEVVAGNERLTMPRGRGRGAIPTIALDSLLARRCAAGWAPVPRWRPSTPADSARLATPDSAGPPPRPPLRGKDAEEAFEEDLRSGCGLAFRLVSASFLRYLLDRAGDPTADVLVKGALSGSTLEQSLAGAATLPRTVPELERAWRAWQEERVEALRRAY